MPEQEYGPVMRGLMSDNPAVRIGTRLELMEENYSECLQISMRVDTLPSRLAKLPWWQFRARQQLEWEAVWLRKRRLDLLERNAQMAQCNDADILAVPYDPR